MIRYTKDGNIFITHDQRSIGEFHNLFSQAIRNEFGEGPFEEKELVVKILLFSFNWMATTFESIIRNTNDVNFVFFLFANHESSVRLYLRRIKGEDIEAMEGISENDLSRNRRILKLALEQTCDVDYTKQVTVTRAVKLGYIQKLEDLLYVGKELYGFAEHLAENRMIEDCNRIFFNSGALVQIERKHHYDHIYEIMEELFQDGFREGIVNIDIVHEFKKKLQECMKIDYDFAGGLIFEIKNHHSPGNIFQTVEPAILPQNLVEKGVSEENASNFYHGLTLSRHNKLKITDAVYKVNSLERYMFRPILIITHNGKERALVGIEKWSESIMVLATNGFEWQRAPKEWTTNNCFEEYLSEKANEHDKFLENEVEKVLTAMQLPFYRHVLRFRRINGPAIPVDVPGLGEMDFVFIDFSKGKIIVADCKYNRARYEMVGFSTDYRNFQIEYEPKLQRKINWLNNNKSAIVDEFSIRFPGCEFNIDNFDVIGMFIINTPTFYMMNGDYRTITINNLERFIKSDYSFPVIKLHTETANGKTIKEIHHPYFKVQ